MSGIGKDERQGAAETACLKREARRLKQQRACELAAQGQRPFEIAALLGVSDRCVARWLRRAGVAYRTLPGGGWLASLT